MKRIATTALRSGIGTFSQTASIRLPESRPRNTPAPPRAVFMTSPTTPHPGVTSPTNDRPSTNNACAKNNANNWKYQNKGVLRVK
jgi:hypothetical protein